MSKTYILHVTSESTQAATSGNYAKVALIGPFDTTESAVAFSKTRYPASPTDPCHIVDLEYTTIPVISPESEGLGFLEVAGWYGGSLTRGRAGVVDPRSTSEENKITVRYGEKGVVDQPVPDTDIPVSVPEKGRAFVPLADLLRDHSCRLVKTRGLTVPVPDGSRAIITTDHRGRLLASIPAFGLTYQPDIEGTDLAERGLPGYELDMTDYNPQGYGVFGEPDGNMPQPIPSPGFFGDPTGVLGAPPIPFWAPSAKQHPPRPTWSVVEPGVLQFGTTKFRITFDADTQTFVASRDGKPFPFTPGDTSLASLKLAVEQCVNNLREVGIDP